MYFKCYNTPVTIAGVGGRASMSYAQGPTRWDYNKFGDVLTAYGVNNPIMITINLSSPRHIENSLKTLYKYRDRGLVSDIDVRELEERIRTLSDLELSGGNEIRSNAALGNINPDEVCESVVNEEMDFDVLEAYTKGKKYIVYRNGDRKIITARGKKRVSDKVLKSIENARKYAHTPEANAKRSKSMKARRKDFGLDKSKKDNMFTTEK